MKASSEMSHSVNDKLNKAMGLVNEAGLNKMGAAKDELVKTYSKGKEQLTEMTEQVISSFDTSIKDLRIQIHKKPLQTVAYAALGGFALGYLLHRRKS